MRGKTWGAKMEHGQIRLGLHPTQVLLEWGLFQVTFSPGNVKFGLKNGD